MKRLLKFLIIGFFVFIFDYMIYEFINATEPPLLSRTISFSIATILAWYLNKRFTFYDRSSRKAIKEFILYLGVSIFAGINNVLSSYFIITELPIVPSFIAIGVACFYAAFINYGLQYIVTFRRNG